MVTLIKKPIPLVSARLVFNIQFLACRSKSRKQFPANNQTYIDLVATSPPDDSLHQRPPNKLLAVSRIKRTFGRPWWEKDLIEEFKLDDKMYKMVICKNTPTVCAKLYKIKHLIKVKPITFPYGPPKDGDVTGTLLKENGEFIVSHRLKPDPQRLQLDLEKDAKLLDSDTLKAVLKSYWI